MPAEQEHLVTQDEFAAEYQAHRLYIRKVCQRFVGPDAAEDLTQSVFLNAWKHRDRFRGGSSMKTWLVAIARNAAMSFLRGERPTEDVSEFQFPAKDISPERKLQLQEAVRIFKGLSARQKAMFGLRHFHGMQIKEIAQVLDVHRGSVWRELKAATAQMRQVL